MSLRTVCIPVRMQLLAIRQSGTEADVNVPIGRSVVQVQDEPGTRVRRVVPIATAKRGPPHEAAKPPRKALQSFNDLSHPPIIFPISLRYPDQTSYL